VQVIEDTETTVMCARCFERACRCARRDLWG
jgi:hypothetical protein